MEDILQDAFNMHSHGLQSFPPEIIAFDNCDIGGNTFTEMRRSALDEDPNREEELSSGKKVGRFQLFDITHRKKDGSHMTIKAAEIMEKLKDKMAEYEAIASSDSSVNLDDIYNRIITEVLGLERYTQAEVQRLRDQMAQMQVSTVEQIAQLKVEVASREVEA
ncbi:hypothetical protein GOBAR_AA06699 [Gossypium barbadense]|uniref:Uncharacterized protein n=1 Tax=Gossypium barbadense TaxID=3634 RepID=A0A2P5YE39_GOSBA|nr:hypothetical protein GOBAR_AA06699 [Gossypium barbadense]